MVTYAQLTAMNTSKLTSAAQASADFGTAMTRQGEAVQTAADIPAGMWAGGDANAAGGMLAALPGPLYDLSDSAKRGKATLDDLATGVNKAKAHLQGAYDAIKGTGITIQPDGTVVTPVVTDPAVAAENDRKAQDARAIIDEALKMAADADTTATEQLNALSGQVNASYMEIPGKQQDLGRAKDLLSTPKNQVKPETAQELNDILSRNNNPEFNRQLMEQLGPKGLIDGSGRFSEAGANLAQNGDTAGADKFRETQRLLGESLASASQNGGLTPQWTQELMNQGAKPMEGNPQNIGYEALAPLLEHGKYDPSFLTPVAEHVTRLDNSSGLGNPSAGPGASVSGLDSNPFVIDGKADHEAPVSNPLNSVMTALDHSPEAASDYFTGNNDEHGLKYNDAFGKPLAPIEGPTDNPNIDYALDRVTGQEPGDPLDVNRVGNALEAAATGVPSDTPADAPRPPRTEEMVNIAEHLVNRFGGEGDGDMDLIPGGKLENMADNMTDIASTYMPEIHNSFLNPLSGDAKLYPEGAMAEFKDEDATAGLLHALGRHEDSFHQLMGASNDIRDVVLAQEYQQNGPEGSWVQEALQPGSTIANILTDAQVEAGVHDAAESDKSANDLTQLGVSGGKIATSAIPFGGALIGEILDQVKNDAQVDSTEQALYDGNVERTDVYDAQLVREKAAIEHLVNQDGVVTEAEKTLLRNVDGEINDAWSAGENEVAQRKVDGMGAPGGK
ncbi:hypothetical protein Snas_3337 [Stackebrandtia nassauensis DSM 44728]|uniref:Uncharacterized protein n=2 Tax=Stackebrandtia TaxID=283810 RepID=D3PUJ0_STANL|nr:hypothetical protein Snas_3337 [Stackebrandtia nassauensis DSM 44728]